LVSNFFIQLKFTNILHDSCAYLVIYLSRCGFQWFLYGQNLPNPSSKTTYVQDSCRFKGKQTTDKAFHAQCRFGMIWFLWETIHLPLATAMVVTEIDLSKSGLMWFNEWPIQLIVDGYMRVDFFTHLPHLCPSLKIVTLPTFRPNKQSRGSVNYSSLLLLWSSVFSMLDSRRVRNTAERALKSLRLSVCRHEKSREQKKYILMKFHIGEFYEKLPRHFNCHLCF
jgi:hypothetical protein